MIPVDPNQATKLADLRALQAAGTNPRVAELVLVQWPAPDGAIYYATRMAADLLESPTVLDQLDGPIELRLTTGIFLDVMHDAGIADDAIDLDFWDGDHEMTRLAFTHGAGVRVEVFYYFPDVDLFVSEFWGHYQPPTTINIDRVQAKAESGFRSSDLPLPARAFYTGCQALFGGLLATQAEIDEGDCPYSRHLAGTATNQFGTDTTWKQSTTFTDGWQQPDFDDSGWSPAVSEGPLSTFPWNHTGGVDLPAFPPTTSANWIWWQPYTAGDLATVYFRKSFTPIGTDALITASGDGNIIGYLNGVQILVGADWTKSQAVHVALPAGVNVLAFKVENFFTAGGVNPGGLIVDVTEGITGTGFGNLDPATGLPFTDCPRNTTQVCTDRLGDSLSFLAFDTVAESHVVHETKGPNITVTSRGNETNLKRPLRVIAGARHVADLDLLAFVVEPDTRHPDEGSVKCLFAVCEGPVQKIINGKINGTTVAAFHANYRVGDKRQPSSSFSPHILNYSGTSLFLGVAQGDFSKAGAEDLRGEVDIEGLRDVRVYSDPTTFTEVYTMSRAWWLLHALRNKRWGYGLDVKRFYLPDFIDLDNWCNEVVGQKDQAGADTTGPRTRFNAEMIDRTAQQQITDICAAGRFGLPFADRGLLRVVPLRRASELFTPTVFTDQAFWSVLNRAPTTAELNTWITALQAAQATSNDALLAECQARQLELFHSAEYAARPGGGVGGARTDTEFVTDCYHSYLRRPPDEAGLTFWLGQVAAHDRDTVLAAFNDSGEFKELCADHPVATFTDRGEVRNICLDQAEFSGGKSSLNFSMQSDAELCNRVVITFDDQTQQNSQIPLTFDDIGQQLRAGRAFGDTSRRAVERSFTAYGVTSIGEAGRLGNLLLNLGEFDEGGIKNNLRVEFVTWYLAAVELHKYQIIKIESDKLDQINDARVAQNQEPFIYFRIRTLTRGSDLTVSISAQAYPAIYYDRIELLNLGPVIPPTVAGGAAGFDPNDPNGPARGKLPFDVAVVDVSTTTDQFRFTIGEEAI